MTAAEVAEALRDTALQSLRESATFSTREIARARLTSKLNELIDAQVIADRDYFVHVLLLGYPKLELKFTITPEIVVFGEVESVELH